MASKGLATSGTAPALNPQGEKMTASEVHGQPASEELKKYLMATLALVGIFVSVIEVFQLAWLNTYFVGQAYFFALMVCFLPIAVVSFFPSVKGPWAVYRPVLAVLSFLVPLYFFATATMAFDEGWEVTAPWHAKIMSLLILALVLKATRWVGGWPLFFVCAILGAFPLFTTYMPGLLKGVGYSFWKVVNFHCLGTESLVGLPTRVVGRILIGYLIFGALLQVCGGGKFFLDMALAILGSRRGGAAKVSIVSSSFFGSLSGSVVANIVTTGTFTIPTMKKAGFPPYYAGSVEACASTGGVLMPPIMGATAFIMAEFLNITYLEVCLAAAIPSVLYYLVLFLQVDSFAAQHGLLGLPKEELPSLRHTLKNGWMFLVSFAVLIWVLVFSRLEAQAPYYASAVLLLLLMVQKDTRPDFQWWLGFLNSAGRTIAHILAMLLGVGLVIGSLSMTGVAFSFAGDLSALAGDNVALMLILGAACSFVLGMGMTVSACYIFLALIMAPALINAGVNPKASHLFFMYCGMLSYITPPVAIGAFSAASLAGAKPMTTGWSSVRLGFALWLLPFMFALAPGLIFETSLLQVLIVFVMTALGILLMVQFVSGVNILFGDRSKILAWPMRFGCLALSCAILVGVIIMPLI